MDKANAALERNRTTGIIVCSVLIGLSAVTFVIAIVAVRRPSMFSSKCFVNQLIKRQLKKDGMSKEQIADYMRELRKQDSLVLPCPREVLEEDITNSITFENGKYYTTVSDYLKNEGCKIVFYELLFDKLADNELLIMQDVVVTKEENTESIYVAYKYRNKLTLDYLTENEETHRYEMLDLLECWNYPTSRRMNKKEKQAFREALRQYDRLHDNVFDIPC
ncbi:MAG: hypothetical protein K2M64_03540 [Clostridia bacterium]|nr:hypothetical protein [Clostridia bacterium]